MKDPFALELKGLVARHLHFAGPWPFVTFRSYVLAGRHIIWKARQHRKGLVRRARALETASVPLWQTQGYNWATGLIFAIGSFLFMLGSALALIPEGPWQPSALLVNIVFFAGSLPFTTAGYMQHFQAANAGPFAVDPATVPARRIALMGWHPRNVGWLSTFTQFIGTVAFNFNTFDSILDPPGWLMQNLAIWGPDMIGSVLFLVSGYLAFIETCHRYWSWKPRSLEWQIVFTNLLGCIAFMVAALLAYVPRGPEAAWIPMLANMGLFLGALGFFVGALLSMRESRAAEPA